MSNHRYLDDYLPVIAIDVAVEEKARFAEMATGTLRKLHNVIQQMKSWREDSARLKSNIWRMKMALRADDKNGNDNQETDPLIAHQRAEISRLEQANDALGNEVASLRQALTRAEGDIAGHKAGGEIAESARRGGEDERERRLDEIPRQKQPAPEAREESREPVLRRLTARLEETARGDRAFEVILASAIGKVVETVVNLSEELVNVHEDLHRFKTKNRNLRRRLDRLRAMLRSRSGNSAEYRKRIGELKSLAEQLTGEMARLGTIREDGSTDAAVPDVVKQVGRLMSDLKDNLKNEREAMIAAGDPDRLRYMKKVVELKVSLRVLAVELRRPSSPSSLSSTRRKRPDSQLNDFLAEIDAEIGKLKVRPMGQHCRIGGVSGARYMTKVAELEDAVKKSAAVIGALRPGSSLDEGATKELGDWIERVCRKIKDLEVFDDRAGLRERVGRLEVRLVRLRLELAEKEERVNALSDECASVRLTLENERGACERVVADERRANERLREDADKRREEMEELLRERACCERRVAELQLMAVEVDASRKTLQELRDEKETLLGDAERMRNTLREREKEIAGIITARDSLRATLGAQVKELRMKLGVASDENAKLKGIIGRLGKRRRWRERLDRLKSKGADEDNGCSGRARSLRDELERLRAESNKSRLSLSKADRRIARLKRALDEAVGDRARLQTEVSELRSNEKSLAHRLRLQTSAGEQAAREYGEVSEALAAEAKDLRSEMERLEAQMSELRTEKGRLDRSMGDVDSKRAALQDQVDSLRSETLELERTRAELGAEVARLRAENSRLAGDLDAAAQSADGRVRVLLTEKNELATRINELDDENAGLRDRLNKARAENEYFSMELNKSTVENDKVEEAKSALLQATCDRRVGEQLRRERDEARRRLNEIGGDRPGTQPNTVETTPRVALHRENNDRESRSEAIEARYPLARSRGCAAHNKLRQRLDCSDAARAGIKVEIGEQEDDETAFEAESDTRVSPDNKARIKDKPKGGSKRPAAENKALKLEPASSGFDADVALELPCAEDGSESPRARSSGLGDAGVVDCVPRRRELVKIRHPRRMSNNCAGHSGDSKMSGDKEGSQVSDIDRLEVENRALKIEVDILRRSLDLSLTDGERTKSVLAEMTKEIRALKSELMSLRDEKAALRSRLEAVKEEFDGSESERTALKDELVASRKSNFDLRLKANELRGAVENLKTTNARLEDGLRNALRETNERSAETLFGSSANIFRNISHVGQNLRAIKKRLEYVPAEDSGQRSTEEDPQRTEGQK